MRLFTIRRLVLGVSIVTACARAEPSRPSPAVDDEARAAATKLKTSLMTKLTAALQEGGPLQALDVCALRAQALTTESGTTRVKVGRTSHRLRNSANRAPAWLLPMVGKLERGETVEASTIAIGEGRFGYYEPIVTQPLCITCHGSDLPQELRVAIARKYPQDKAVGFAAGDPRGLLWVEVSPR